MESRWETIRKRIPIDDPSKMLSVFLMAQKRDTRRSRRLPMVLLKVIGEYSDYNEIKMLFRVLKSPEDRHRILGFSSFREMDETLQSRQSKGRHLTELIRVDEVGFFWGPTLYFDVDVKSIWKIDWFGKWNGMQYIVDGM